MFSSNATQVSSDANYIEDVFSTWLYDGNASTQAINNGINLSTYGGMVWAKSRSNVASNALFDTVRGGSSLLVSNTTAAAYTGSTYINPFSANGFTWAIGDNQVNQSGRTYASWTFRKQPKFFDVVTYTGNGTLGRTVAHGLGAVPGCIIVKRTDSAQPWIVWHRASLGGNSYLYLNDTAAADPVGADMWGNTVTYIPPTSTNFTVAGNNAINASGGTYVAYIFAHNAGGFGLTGTDNVISCGSFTTDGSGNATVNLGYEPQWVLEKSSSAAQQWNLLDVMRGMSNTEGNLLVPNSSAAESAVGGAYIVPTATGFTVANHAPSRTYIYIAIRRGPMKVPTNGTKVFSPLARTGTGTDATITGLGFTPDLAISGLRTIAGFATAPSIIDRLRGASQWLTTADTASEANSTALLNSFASMDGYTLGAGDTTAGWNVNANSYINWNFKRAPGFFDEVCYTGTGAVQNVSHNLGVVPELIIAKGRTVTNNWPVYSSASGATNFIYLNSTQAAFASSAFWNNTIPTSSVFTVGVNNPINTAASSNVAYLFATCPGVSKVGSYTGNGATQTINCGFTGGARFVLIKRTNSTGGWYVYDTARGMTTLTDPYFFLNDQYTGDVATLGSVITSTGGFTVNAAVLAAINTNAASYIFLAIA